MAAPSAPINIYMVGNTIFWDAVDGASYYNLYYKKDKTPNEYFESLNNWDKNIYLDTGSVYIVNEQAHLSNQQGVVAAVDIRYDYMPSSADNYDIGIDVTAYNAENVNEGMNAEFRMLSNSNTDFARVEFYRDNPSTYKINGYIYTDDTTRKNVFVNVSTRPTGKRIQREDTTISLYYNIGAGWVLITSHDCGANAHGLNQSWLKAHHRVQNGGYVRYDNFIIEPSVEDSGTQISGITSLCYTVPFVSGEFYCFVVTAVNDDGESDPSVEIYGTTEEQGLFTTAGEIELYNVKELDQVYVLQEIEYLFDVIEQINIVSSSARELTLVGGTSIAAGGNPNCVKVVGQNAFVGTNGALVIINVADISNPVELYSFVEDNTTNAISMIDIVGNYCYIISTDYFSILDISDFENISTLGQISGAGEYLDYISGMRIRGNYAYLTAYTSDSLVIVDISDPEAPTRIGQIFGSANYLNGATCVELSYDGNYAYVPAANQLRVTAFDISDPENITIAGSLYKVVGALASNTEMIINGNYLYLLETYSSGGIVVIDITDPATPKWHSSISGLANGFLLSSWIVIDSEYAYVTNQSQTSPAGYEKGLVVYDISGITPVYAWRYDGLAEYDAKGLYILGSTIYVTYTSPDHSMYIFGYSKINDSLICHEINKLYVINESNLFSISALAEA